MKKSLIALAALATVGAAQAQSSVTVYGLLDTGYQSSETKTRANAAAETFTKSSGPGTIAAGSLASSRLGVSGTEDLGGGLRATFNVEWALTAGTGVLDTANPARTSIIGLSDNKLGTIELGRQTTGIHNVIAGFNPIGSNNMVGDISYSSSTRLHATEVRANGIVYKSPVINGFQARVDYQDNTSGETQAADSGAKVKNTGFSVTYRQGALSIAAGTNKYELKNALRSAVNGIDSAGTVTTTAASSNIVAPISAITAANDQSEAKVDVVSARYVLGKATLFALHGQRTVKTEASSALAQSGKLKATQFGIGYPVSAKLAVNAIYGEGTMKAGDVSASRNDRDTKAYLVNAVYSLSKRTNAYVAYGYEEAVTKTAGASSVAVGDYVKSNQLALGVRHSF